MSTTDPIRALCAELAGCLDDALTFTVQGDTERSMRQLVARARELLATQPPEPAEGPISVEELRAGWNQQADEFNQWESLDLGEQLAWAQARAVARYGAPRSAPIAVADVRYEYNVFDSVTDEWAASGEAPTLEEAIREGKHYLAQYNEDGPHRLELREVRVLPEVKP